MRRKNLKAVIFLGSIFFIGMVIFNVYIGNASEQCNYCRNIKQKPQTLHSTCSDHATYRGPGQKVLSYAIYGSFDSGYFRGILENLKAMRQHYPGYVMRLYHNKKVENFKDFEKLCDLFCNNPDLDLCNTHNIGKLKKTYLKLLKAINIYSMFQVLNLAISVPPSACCGVSPQWSTLWSLSGTVVTSTQSSLLERPRLSMTGVTTPTPPTTS
jgi:hypothetical protein